MPYEPNYEKITGKELNPEFRSKIENSHIHTLDTSIHISEEDRELWNRGGNLDIATSTESGLISSDMVKKLENIEEKANNYTHPDSGVTTGSYIMTTVDKYGHVTKGENPESLDITVTNAKMLNSITADSYARLISPQFAGRPTAPTVANNIVGDNIATTKYVNNILNMALEGTAYIHPESGITNAGLPEGFEFKGSSESYNNISKDYSKPSKGWIVQILDTNTYYYYNGSDWVETDTEQLKDMWTDTYALVSVNRYGHVVKGEGIEVLGLEEMDNKITESNTIIADLEARLTKLSNTLNTVQTNINNVLKNMIYITEAKSNDTSWYRIWSDGRIEQGGYCTGSGYAERIIDLPIAFLDLNYAVFITGSNKNETSSGTNYWYEKSTTKLGIASHGNCYWYAFSY